MKRILKLNVIVFLILTAAAFMSCTNYVDELTLAGYTYKMNDLKKVKETTTISGSHTIDDSSEVSAEGYLINPTTNPIKFGKDGSTVTWTIDGRKHTGTYSVNMDESSITLDVSGPYLTGTYKFTYENKGKNLRSPEFESFDDDLDDDEIAYPASDGPYHLIYTLE